jgi:ABC-type uncharacterized transport system involved in gliding motility auxiliary subunit
VALMRDRMRDISPYVSILGLVILASSLFLRSAPSVPDQLTPVLAVVGIVLLFAWPVFRWDEFRSGFAGRQARHGTNSVVLIISVLGILAVANYLGSLWYWTWDLTTNRQFSISRATGQILDDVQAPVRLVAVLDPQSAPTDLENLERLVEQYKQRSPQIEFQHLDPNRDRLELEALASELGQDAQTLVRSVVAISAGRDAQVYAFDEQALTEAIVKATRDRDLKVWFTTGHGERSLDTDYTQVKRVLESQGYTVTARNLIVMTETLTADSVDAVVIAGPGEPFVDEEVENLAAYVEGGGSVLVMADPQLDGTDLNLDPIVAQWGISLPNDVVLDPEQAFLGNLAEIIVLAPQLGFHSITRDLMDLQQWVLFPSSRSLTVGEAISTSLTTTKLAESSASSWGETDLAGLANPQAAPTPGEGEIRGPLALAVAGEGGVDDGRVVVFGTSLFVSDAYIQQVQTLNLALFSNALNWLTQEEDLITIPPTEPDSRPLQTPTNPRLLLLATAVLMPLAVLGMGAFVWWRRR